MKNVYTAQDSQKLMSRTQKTQTEEISFPCSSYNSVLNEGVLMYITYCNTGCTIGKAARDKFLMANNSIFDAVMDFNFFTENCAKSCPYKELANKNKENLR